MIGTRWAPEPLVWTVSFFGRYARVRCSGPLITESCRTKNGHSDLLIFNSYEMSLKLSTTPSPNFVYYIVVVETVEARRC